MRRLKVLGWRIASLLLVLGLHVMVLATILAGPARGPALDLPEAPVVTVTVIESAPEPVLLPAEVVTGLPKPVKTVRPKPKPKKKIPPEPRLTEREVPAPKVPLQATEEVQASLRPATAATSGLGRSADRGVRGCCDNSWPTGTGHPTPCGGGSVCSDACQQNYFALLLGSCRVGGDRDKPGLSAA